MTKTKQFFRSTPAALALAGMVAGLGGSALRPGATPQPRVAQAAAVAAPVPAPRAGQVQEAPAGAPAPAGAADPQAGADPQVAAAGPAPEPDLATDLAARDDAAAASAPAGLVPVRLTSRPGQPSFADLRARMRWMRVQVHGREVLTPDPDSRLLLVRSAAERAGLAEVGLDFRDVYGVITAETSWVPRTGMGRNGVASQGLAQLEPATARALGVRDANDPVEAVHGAALLLREAGAWSARRLAGLRLSGAEYAARLRAGISVYYNLSSRARQRWNGATHSLPVETRRHIFNVRAGIEQAERLQTGLAGGEALPAPVAPPAAAPARQAVPQPARAAAAPARRETPHPVGTISWSGQGGDARAGSGRAGTHVVWSNGAVTREGGRAHGGSGGRRG